MAGGSTAEIALDQSHHPLRRPEGQSSCQPVPTAEEAAQPKVTSPARAALKSAGGEKTGEEGLGTDEMPELGGKKDSKREKK